MARVTKADLEKNVVNLNNEISTLNKKLLDRENQVKELKAIIHNIDNEQDSSEMIIETIQEYSFMERFSFLFQGKKFLQKDINIFSNLLK